jgi:transcriptional regulator with XRE-family HTH domain
MFGSGCAADIDGKSRQMTITVEQVKEARTLLGWSQFRLAVRSAVDVTRINHFERGMCMLTHSQLLRIKEALEASGVEFTTKTEHPGVKLTKAGR